ncbi:hypothetical protein ACFQY9_11210 [Microvirga aerilata]|uniref:hypothetical protein n=1 Tax=Microvirga aerilata TaxID=670292 RepID=UPI00362A0C55
MVDDEDEYDVAMPMTERDTLAQACMGNPRPTRNAPRASQERASGSRLRGTQ